MSEYVGVLSIVHVHPSSCPSSCTCAQETDASAYVAGSPSKRPLVLWRLLFLLVRARCALWHLTTAQVHRTPVVRLSRPYIRWPCRAEEGNKQSSFLSPFFLKMRIQLSIISLLPLLACSWAKPAPTDATISAPTSSVTTASGSASAAASSVAASVGSTSSASPSTIDTPMSSSPTSVVFGSATATLSSSATSSAVAPHNTSSPPIALGYVADYHIDKTNLQNYPFENYTHMSFFGT